MIQEITTYLIVAVAVAMLFVKARKKIFKKFIKTKESAANAQQHKCPDCTAECILRDASSTFIQNNKELCKKSQNAVSDRF